MTEIKTLAHVNRDKEPFYKWEGVGTVKEEVGGWVRVRLVTKCAGLI